ncbi:MAG: hypothetical protein IK123_04690 [Lachnospiraceae bacterium]|nr:hypothetical protein [Lachnospiraceae bacterium]
MKRGIIKAVAAFLAGAFVVTAAPARTEAATSQKWGIDVSYHQGAIDWSAVKASGVQFAFIRAGSFKSGTDAYFHQNMKGATSVGIPVGIYVYSYATTTQMAANEALFAISVAKDYPVSYPIAYDIEDSYHKGMSQAEIQALINTFCSTIENAGYTPIVYSGRNFFRDKIGSISQDKWVAQYAAACDYPSYSFWQSSSKGRVNGIKGNVDIDYQYKDYSGTIIANGFKTQKGKTFYMENYKMHRGWLELNGKKYYFDPLLGVMQTGLVADTTGVYYMGDDGAMQTGLVEIAGNKFYFDPATGGMLTNTTVTIGKQTYMIDVQGIATDVTEIMNAAAAAMQQMAPVQAE